MDLRPADIPSAPEREIDYPLARSAALLALPATPVYASRWSGDETPRGRQVHTTTRALIDRETGSAGAYLGSGRGGRGAAEQATQTGGGRGSLRATRGGVAAAAAAGGAEDARTDGGVEEAKP